MGVIHNRSGRHSLIIKELLSKTDWCLGLMIKELLLGVDIIVWNSLLKKKIVIEKNNNIVSQNNNNNNNFFFFWGFECNKNVFPFPCHVSVSCPYNYKFTTHWFDKSLFVYRVRTISLPNPNPWSPTSQPFQNPKTPNPKPFPPFIFHFNYGIRSHYWRRFCRLQRRWRRRRRRRRRGAATAANSVADAQWNWAAAVSEQDVRHGGRPGDRPDTVVEPHQQQLRGLEPAGVR